jgi:hypothetical protein
MPAVHHVVLPWRRQPPALSRSHSFHPCQHQQSQQAQQPPLQHWLQDCFKHTHHATLAASHTRSSQSNTLTPIATTANTPLLSSCCHITPCSYLGAAGGQHCHGHALSTLASINRVNRGISSHCGCSSGCGGDGAWASCDSCGGGSAANRLGWGRWVGCDHLGDSRGSDGGDGSAPADTLQYGSMSAAASLKVMISSGKRGA